MLLAPLDVAAGGTWFGLNRNGVFAALTNVACARPDPERRSRGLLIVDALAAHTAEEAAGRLADLPRGAYNPFNVLVADAERAFAFTYEERATAVSNDDGVFLVGNAPVAGPEPAKIAGLRERVAEGLANPSCDWLEHLAARCADHEPAGPRGPLDALCVHTPTYGTRSSSLLRLADGGLDAADSVLRFSDGPPCEGPYQDFTPLLRDLGQGRPACKDTQ